MERAKIVSLAASGKQNMEIAVELGITNQKAARWRDRFLELGLVGLEKDAPRPGRTPRISNETIRKIVERTTLSKPRNATHRSTRTMAAESGISEAAILLAMRTT